MAIADEDRTEIMMCGEDDYDSEEQADPFSQLITAHPAIGDTLGIASDIYESLFDGIFNSEAFDRWVHRRNSWQLHCLGGPGAGKVNFTCMAPYIAPLTTVDNLRGFDSQAHQYRVYAVA